METDLLERREGVDAERVDDVTMLEHLASTEPGPLSMMVLEGIDPAKLDSDARLDYAKAWDRQQRWSTARAQNALAEVLIADLPDDDDLIGLEISYRADMAAVTMQWPPVTAFGQSGSATRYRIARHVRAAERRRDQLPARGADRRCDRRSRSR